MSNDTPPNDSDISLAKRRLARELRIFVVVQVIALCIVVLGLVLFGSDCIPNYPAWDEIHLLCGVLALSGMVVFVVAAFWGFGKIIYAGFASDLMTTYFLGAWIFLVAFFLLSPIGGWPPTYFAIFRNTTNNRATIVRLRNKRPLFPLGEG